MTKRKLLFSILLAGFCARLALADSPITQLENIRPKESAFVLQAVQTPLVITSSDEAAKYFEGQDIATLKNKVDFAKQEILLFAWRGSGQDRLENVVLESFPEEIRFTYQRGRTRDLRQHFRLYIVRSNVKCSVNGKPIDRTPVDAVQVKVKGQWKPAKMPLPKLAKDKTLELKVRGTLTHGVVAIGGETTGTTIRFGQTTWDLDLRRKKTFDSVAEKLNGKRVVVTGALAIQQGIETGNRTILTVDSLKSAEH